MKSFALWILVSFVAWGGAFRLLDGHFRAAPGTALVVLDTSLAMRAVWDAVPAALDRIDDAPYTLFTLASPRGPIHPEAPTLTLGPTQPYGPREFSTLASLGAEADRRILVTNAPPSETAGLSGWEIVTP